MPLFLNLHTKILHELQSLSEELTEALSTWKHFATSSMPTPAISTKRADLTRRQTAHFGLGIAISTVKRHVANRSQEFTSCTKLVGIMKATRFSVKDKRGIDHENHKNTTCSSLILATVGLRTRTTAPAIDHKQVSACTLRQGPAAHSNFPRFL